jgi:hypothetical protein
MSPNAPTPLGLEARELSHWIESDSLLRDEAVLFGWVGEREIAAKTDAIQSYYEQKIEAVKREKDGLDAHEAVIGQRITDLGAEIEASARLREADGARLEEAHRARRDTYDLLRYGVGVALALLICGFNYVVVYELLGGSGPVQTEAAPAGGAAAQAVTAPPFAATWIVALGVTLLGMFTLFTPVSILFRRESKAADDNPDQAEQGKLWVVEIVPALAAAFFTAVWGGEPTLLHTVASFLFVAALFIFAGKLLLSLLPRVTIAYKQWRAYRELVAEVQANRDVHQSLLAERDSQHRARFDLQDTRRRLPSVEELNRARERKVNLFLSEVQFARMATRQITAAGAPTESFAAAGA